MRQQYVNPMMTPERFFELLLPELESQKEMQPYYKFLGKESSFHFRRNYFLQRLRYLWNQIQSGGQDKSIWDCGCGYGTTCLFLAMNGIPAHGTTLEFYYKIIEARKQYWQQYGDTSLFTASYENLFDNHPTAATYDWIIVQDTLHHLEPINDALKIFHHSLKPGGKILSIEENGNNIIQRLKLYKYRGNKRIITFYDEKLQKEILLGNENIRKLAQWTELFENNGFKILPDSVNYVRYYLPINYRFSDPGKLIEQEEKIQQSANLRREYFFFGLNFVGVRL